MIKENGNGVQVTHAGRIRRRKGSNEVPADAGQPNGKQLLVNDHNKYKSMLIRAYSSIWMIGGFIFVVYMGHLYIWAMVVIIQIFMAKELFGLLRKVNEDKQLPGFRHLNWHFFFTAMLFVYGRILSQRLVNTVTTDKVLYKVVGNLIKYHMVTCYFLYIAGFVWFILSLKKKMYKYQFGQYAWTHMILIVVFTQSSFTVANIFEGIFWFLLPASLIVINDIAAYFFGFFFGKTPLIKLSPKKTWEGFIGASVTTIISAFVLANFMGRFQWLTCPRKDLSTGWLQCDPGPLFTPDNFSLPGWLPEWFPWTEMEIMPVQWHALGLGLFASIIAPFGGFFASEFKRAFKIKDFGDSIPGHGGMTDRMDCQMVMAVFAYIYHQSFIVAQSASVGMIFDQIKRELFYLTVGIGSACSLYCLTVFSIQAAVSYATGVLFSCLYLQLLYRYSDNLSREAVPQIFRQRKIKRIGIRSDDLEDTFERVVRGCGMALSSPRLVIPAAIYGLWGLSQHFANDFFQLTPAMVGVFAYKAAALVQVYRDNEDLQLILPGNEED